MDIRQALPKGFMYGEYEILDCVGYGGSSLVYKVKKGSKVYILKEIYPIKLAENKRICRCIEKGIVIPTKEIYQKRLDEYFNLQENELKVAETLRDSLGENDPYILQAELIEFNGVKSLLLETEGGETLFEVLNKRKENGKIEYVENLIKVFELTKRILECINRIHSKSYVHADISPDNLYISNLMQDNDVARRTIKAIDYNNTCLISDVKNKKFSSKKNYSSTEIIIDNQKSKIGYSSDLYSVGVILCEMLNEHHKIDNSTITEFNSVYFADETNEVIKATISLINQATVTRINNCQSFIDKIDRIIYLINNKERLENNFAPSDKFFVGRKKELEEIQSKFDNGSNLAIIKGIGGVGKSAISNYYATTHSKNYEKIIVIPYQGSIFNTIINDNAVHITNFNINKKLPENQDTNLERQKIYYDIKLQKLSNLVDKKTLLIIDNMNNGLDENFDDIKKLNCNILISTRNSFPDIKPIELLPFEDINDSMMLFKNNYTQELSSHEEQMVKDIIAKIGALPLIIELIAKVTQTTDMYIKEIYDKISEVKFEYPKENIEFNLYGKGYDKSIREMLDIIFDLSVLSQDDNEIKLAEDILRNLSLIEYTGIRQREFQEFCGFADIDSKNCISKLIATGFISKTHNNVISLHQIISEFFCEKLKPTEINCSKLIKSIMPDKEENLKSLDFETRQTISNRAYFASISIKIEEDFTILLRSTDILKSLSEFDKAIALQEKTIKIQIELFGEKNYDLVNGYNNLAKIYYEKTCYDKAIELYKKVLDTEIELFGEKNSGVATFYNNLAGMYCHKNDYNKAIELYKKALNIKKELIKKDKTEVANAYKKLIRFNLKKKLYTQAVKIYKKSKWTKNKLFIGEMDDIASWYSNLGIVYYQKSDYNKAIKVYKKALDIRLSLFGNKNLDITYLYNNIAKIYEEKADYDKAIELYKKTLDIRLSLFGEKKFDVALAYNDLATGYYNKTDYDKAIELYEKSLEIKLFLFGEKNSSVASTYNNIANTYAQKADYDKAIELYKKSSCIKTELFGEKNLDVALTYNNLAGCYLDKYDYDKAVEMNKKALNILLELFGEKNFYVAICYRNLGDLYFTKLYEGKEQYETLMSYIEKINEYFTKAKEIYINLGLKNSSHYKYVEDGLKSIKKFL